MEIIPALALAIQAILSLFGFEYDFSATVEKLIVVVNTVFVVLVILGVVNDPTVEGMTDSKRALNYTKPNKDK